MGRRTELNVDFKRCEGRVGMNANLEGNEAKPVLFPQISWSRTQLRDTHVQPATIDLWVCYGAKSGSMSGGKVSTSLPMIFENPESIAAPVFCHSPPEVVPSLR